MKQDFYEQSTEEIWSAVTECVRGVVSEGAAGKEDRVRGIGFDATCSMAIVGKDGKGIR